jgi:hypothetical protein
LNRYFTLFEGVADPAPFDELGHSWRITELSCKPFPSARATHGGIDALQRLMREEDITAERVVACRFCVPPLTARLIGRPITKLMTPNYARLCLQYVGAVCLRRGTRGLDDFTAEALGDPQTLAVAHRLQVVEEDNPDPNALLPQRVEIDLAGGRTVPDLWTRSSAAPCDRSRPMPCARSLRSAGAQSLGCRSINVRLCGTGYQLLKTSKMFAYLQHWPPDQEAAKTVSQAASLQCDKTKWRPFVF